MGGTLSHLGSNIASMTPTSLKGLVKTAGLPLEVDDSFSSSDLHEPKKVRAQHPPPLAYPSKAASPHESYPSYPYRLLQTECRRPCRCTAEDVCHQRPAPVRAASACLPLPRLWCGRANPPVIKQRPRPDRRSIPPCAAAASQCVHGAVLGGRVFHGREVHDNNPAAAGGRVHPARSRAVRGFVLEPLTVIPPAFTPVSGWRDHAQSL